MERRLVKVGSVDEVPERRGREVVVEGRRIALFRVKDEYYAVGELCLHRGGPLSEGELENYTVTCPWHGWKYDVRTGAFEVIPTLKVHSYRVHRQGNDLYLEMGDQKEPVLTPME